jgi:hypothetical protein
LAEIVPEGPKEVDVSRASLEAEASDFEGLMNEILDKAWHRSRAGLQKDLQLLSSRFSIRVERRPCRVGRCHAPA